MFTPGQRYLTQCEVLENEARASLLPVAPTVMALATRAETACRHPHCCCGRDRISTPSLMELLTAVPMLRMLRPKSYWLRPEFRQRGLKLQVNTSDDPEFVPEPLTSRTVPQPAHIFRYA